MTNILTYDKAKVEELIRAKIEELIRKKREELKKLEGTCEAYQSSQDPTICLTTTVASRFCSELLDIWSIVDLLIGSTFEARELVGRLFGIVDKLPRGDDPSLDKEVNELKEKWKEYEPTLVEIKKAIDREIKVQKRRAMVQKEMVS